MPVTAIIDSIKRDSLFLVQYTIVSGPAGFDTAGKYNLLFSITNIGSFPRKRHGVGIFNNGTLLLAAGTGFLLLNVVNTLSEGEKFFGKDNLGYLSLGAAMLGTGLVQKAVYNSRSEYVLGKKYKLKYLPVTNN